MFVQNLFTLKSMDDFQPNTIYGYPGGELIGACTIMMQVEDYTQPIWCTYHNNHVLPLVYPKSTSINYAMLRNAVPFIRHRGSTLYVGYVWLVVLFQSYCIPKK